MIKMVRIVEITMRMRHQRKNGGLFAQKDLIPWSRGCRCPWRGSKIVEDIDVVGRGLVGPWRVWVVGVKGDVVVGAGRRRQF